MEADKLLDASARLAEALKDNPAADTFIGFLQWVLLAIFAYFFVSMLLEKLKQSRADRMLNSVESALRENTKALGQVASALERLED